MSKNYLRQFEYDLNILTMIVAASDDWDENKVKRASDGKFASKVGEAAAKVKQAIGKRADDDQARAAEGIAKIKKSVSENYSKAKIQEHFGDLMASLKSNLGKVQQAGAGKLAEIAAHPKVKEMRAMAADAVKKMGQGAETAYNKVNAVVNQGIAEISKRVAPLKKAIDKGVDDAQARASEGAAQTKKFADDVMKSVQDAITSAQDAQLEAAAGAVAATVTLAIIAGATVAATSALTSTPLGFGSGAAVGLFLAKPIDDSIKKAKASIQKFQVNQDDKKTAANVNKIMDDLSAQLKSAVEIDKKAPATATA